MPAHSERGFDRFLNEGGIFRPVIMSDCVRSKGCDLLIVLLDNET